MNKTFTKAFSKSKLLFVKVKIIFRSMEGTSTMEIANLYTKTGGKIHIHFGKIVTTNLWSQWVEVTNLGLIQELKLAHGQTAEFQKIQQDHLNDWQTLTKPYVRTKQGAPRGVPTANQPTSDPAPDEKPTVEEDPTEVPNDNPDVIKAFRIDAVGRMQKFFSEFKFTPAARFVNTFAKCASAAAAKDYVTGYVKLINNCDANDIIEKIKSPEFAKIADDILKYPPAKQINTRLDVYFGDAGTGKTTTAIKQYPEASVVPCNSSMLPDELMRTFDFNDENGHPVFKPSTLQKAMIAGKPIIFDEINLLSFDCLRLLQTLTDGKNEINYNGDTIKIADGFKIIGTMNLVVNDQVYNLPEPLVDRCSKISEFTLTTEALTDYAF